MLIQSTKEIRLIAIVGASSYVLSSMVASIKDAVVSSTLMIRFSDFIELARAVLVCAFRLQVVYL